MAAIRAGLSRSRSSWVSVAPSARRPLDVGGVGSSELRARCSSRSAASRRARVLRRPGRHGQGPGGRLGPPAELDDGRPGHAPGYRRRDRPAPSARRRRHGPAQVNTTRSSRWTTSWSRTVGQLARAPAGPRRDALAPDGGPGPWRRRRRRARRSRPRRRRRSAPDTDDHPGREQRRLAARRAPGARRRRPPGSRPRPTAKAIHSFRAGSRRGRGRKTVPTPGSPAERRPQHARRDRRRR